MDAQPAARHNPYFVNAPVDFFFIAGATWIAYLGMLAVGVTERTQTTVMVTGALLWIVNYPHFSMTSYRLYHSVENIRRFPLTALGVPVLLALVVFAAFTNPDTVAPMFVKLFMIWSPYHFSGQTVGITLIYARRNGVPVGRYERLALSSFVFGTFVFSTLRAEAVLDPQHFLGVSYTGLGVPPWAVALSEWGMVAAGAGFAFFVIEWSMRNRRMMPLLIVLPAATQYLWFVTGAYEPAFKELVPMLHSLQYILVAWGMQLKEKMELRHIEPSRRYVGIESTRWYLINIAGGAFLFWVLPHLGAKAGYALGFSSAIMLAAANIHHFMVDGVIWKLKQKTNSQPLMMNVREVVGTDAGIRGSPAQ